MARLSTNPQFQKVIKALEECSGEISEWMNGDRQLSFEQAQRAMGILRGKINVLVSVVEIIENMNEGKN